MLVGGLGAIAFSVFGLGIVTFQRFIFTLPSPRPPPPEMFEAFAAMHRVLLTHLPIWIGLGLLGALFGDGLRRGLTGAGWRIQVLFGAAAVEVGAYSVHAAIVVAPALEAMFSLNPFMPQFASRSFFWVSSVATTLVVWIPLAFVAWLVRSATRREMALAAN